MDDLSSNLSSYVCTSHQSSHIFKHVSLWCFPTVEHDLAVRRYTRLLGVFSMVRLICHNFALHINHLVFFNTYLFGASVIKFLYVADSKNNHNIIIRAMNLMSSRNQFGEVLTGAFYIVFVVGGVAVGAYFFNEHMMKEFGKVWKKILVDLGIVLGSFVMQILGHCMFEEFHSPPNLAHGFVAAPLLEFVSLVFRLGFLHDLRVEVDREVEKIRNDARHRRSALQNKDSLLSSSVAEEEEGGTVRHVRKRSGTNIPPP